MKKEKTNNRINVPGVTFGNKKFGMLMKYDHEQGLYQMLICAKHRRKREPLFLIQMTKPYLKKYIGFLKKLLRNS